MPTVNISEHTDRPEFIDFLKQKMGVQFRVYQELTKVSLKEDIILFRADGIIVNLEENTIHWDSEDAVVAVIETKIKGETNLEKHEPQLLKYIQDLECKLGFITNYVDIISYEFLPDLSIQSKELHRDENIETLTEYIANFIAKSTKITIQKSPLEIIKILEDSIDDLMSSTSQVSSDVWEKILRFSDEPEKEAIKKELTKAEQAERDVFFQRSASYIAITQILFYIVFRMYRIEHNVNESPKLRPLSSSNGIPTQIQDIIEDVPKGSLNFKAIFGKNKDVFSQLGDKDAAPVLKNIIHTLEGISARFVIENDLIGQIFQRLMPFEVRKKFAAFYTLYSAAELLCNLAIQDKDVTVYDPACGSGTLLVYAYQRKKELGLNQHKKILEQIKGSDISDIATMMSTVNLAIQDPSKWTDEVSIYPHDAFDLISGLMRYYDKTQETPDGRKRVSPIFAPDKNYRVDVLLANPPFTRGSRLSDVTKAVLRQLHLVLKYEIPTNFKAINLHAFFLLIAPDLVKKKSGIIAFILPQGAINSDCMIPVWQAVFNENFGIKFLIEASDIDESFSDSHDQEIIAVLQRNYVDNARFVKLFGKLNDKDVKAIVEQIESSEKPLEKTSDCLIQVIPQAKITSQTCMDWNLNPSPSLILIYPKFVPLNLDQLLNEEDKAKYDHDLTDCIHLVPENASRPVDYWFLPNKYWTIETLDENEITLRATSDNTVISGDVSAKQTLIIPMDAVVPAIARSLRDYANYPPIIPIDMININNYFLTDENRKDVKKYCAWGKSAHQMQLVGTSHSKYSPIQNDGGILTRIDFSGGKILALRFLNPSVGSQTIRIGYKGTTSTDADLFFAYLTSSLFLLDALEKSRTRRAEFARINQVDFYRLYRFPNLTELKKRIKQMNRILSASEQLNANILLKDRPSFPEMIKNARIDINDPQRKLDEAWLDFLNFPIEYLDSIYQEIENRIQDMVFEK